MVPISGFTIIRNALQYDFPVVASIRSILPVCDQLAYQYHHRGTRRARGPNIWREMLHSSYYRGMGRGK